MGKFDTRSRMMRGIQPGLAPIPPNMGLIGSKSQMPNVPIGNQQSQDKTTGMMSPDVMNRFMPPSNIIPPMPNEDGIGGNLISPSFDDVMNKKPMMDNSVGKRAIGTRQSLMNKFNSGY